eukprot:1624014-Pleurochrysis_carterae.AAC.1
MLRQLTCRPQRSGECLVEPHGSDRGRVLVTLIHEYHWTVARPVVVAVVRSTPSRVAPTPFPTLCERGMRPL